MDASSTLVVAFGSSTLLDHRAPLHDLASAFPESHVAGCSTAGEILDTAVSDDTLTVAICRFDHTRVGSTTTALCGTGDSYAAGRRLAGNLHADDLRGVLVFSDGLSANGSQLVHGLNDALGPDVVITGGLAADADHFARTWVMTHHDVATGFVSAVGLYGDHVGIGHGSEGGWDIFGIERRVTRATGNILYELDGRPALALYKAYLGDRAAGLPATALLFPLGLRVPGLDDILVRTILSVSEADQSLTFAGDIPEGSMAQLMHGNRDRLIDGAAQAGRMTSSRTRASAPTLALAISCVGRRIVLGQHAEDEVEAVYDSLPRDTTLVGFYSYGEISPLASGRCDLHNQTMTLTTIWEE